jgi:hypothetical protein
VWSIKSDTGPDAGSIVGRGSLAFVAIGALLGVKILRRNAEHVVTLNANTMKNRLPGSRRLVFRGVGLRLNRFVCHERILAQGRAPKHPCRARAFGLRHPAPLRPHPRQSQSEPCHPPPGIRVPPETLLEYQVLIPPVQAGRTRTR